MENFHSNRNCIQIKKLSLAFSAFTIPFFLRNDERQSWKFMLNNKRKFSIKNFWMEYLTFIKNFSQTIFPLHKHNLDSPFQQNFKQQTNYIKFQIQEKIFYVPNSQEWNNKKKSPNSTLSIFPLLQLFSREENLRGGKNTSKRKLNWVFEKFFHRKLKFDWTENFSIKILSRLEKA